MAEQDKDLATIELLKFPDFPDAKTASSETTVIEVPDWCRVTCGSCSTSDWQHLEIPIFRPCATRLRLLISHSSRTMNLYVVRIGREQFLPQQPVTSRSTSESIQRKLIKQRNT
jgi:hypothetical protein